MFKKIIQFFRCRPKGSMNESAMHFGLEPRNECPKCGHKYSKYDGWQGGPL